MNNTVSKQLDNPMVQAEECFIVVPLHSKGQTGARQWDGPFKDRSDAQKAAVRWMLESGAWSMSVFKLVGVVSKPAPELEWHDAEKKTS